MKLLVLSLPLIALLSPIFAHANHSSGSSPNEVCKNMSWDSDKNKCLQATYNRYFDGAALSVCAKMSWDSDKISCLHKIANADFNHKAVGVCANFSWDSDKQKCLQTIAGYDFDYSTLDICKSMSWDSEKLSCLAQNRYPMSQLGGHPQGGNSSTGDILTDIILDAIDLALQEMINKHASDNFAATCKVENSTGRKLGEVAIDDLNLVGSDFAFAQNSCVVTNVKGEARTRTLIGKNGQIIGSKLTEKETSHLKSQLGYKSCRVMTCVQ